MRAVQLEPAEPLERTPLAMLPPEPPDPPAWPARRLAALRARLAPPTEMLARIRWAFLWLSLAMVGLLGLVHLAGRDAGRLAPALAGVALVWLAGYWLHHYRHPRSRATWEVVAGLMLLLVGLEIGHVDSPLGLAYLGLLYGGLGYGSLTGSGRRVIIRVLVYHLAYVGAVLLGSDSRLGSLLSLQVLAQLPGLAMVAAVAYLLAAMLTRHQSDERRQRILVQAGADLMATDDRGRIAAVAATAAQALLDGRAAWVRLALGTTELAVVADADAEPAPAGGVIRLADLPDGGLARLRAGQTVRLLPLDAAARAGLGLPAAARVAIAVPLLLKGELHGLLLLAAAASLPLTAADGVEVLAGQVALALERAALADDLRQREAVFRSLVQHSSDAITVIGEDTTIIFQTPMLERLLDRGAADVIGTRLTDLLHPDDRARAVPLMNDILAKPGGSVTIQWRWRRGDGAWLPVETVATNLLHDAAIEGIVLSSRDVSKRQALEEQLFQQAYQDPLTALANRARFMDRLEQALTGPVRAADSVVVLYLDLDRFKVINDSLGHEAGDFLLTTVARRLQACVRAGDTVARLGGDEFAVLLTDVVDVMPAIRMAERILDQMQEPVVLAGHEVFVTTSIGIALGRIGRDRAEALVRHADVAMYAAKRQGRACFMVFDPSMDAGALERLDLEADLRRALRGRELELHFQPLVGLKTGQVTELEALVRWRHPARGLLKPGDFISLAEETGLILPVGEWVLAEACRRLRAWQTQRPADPPLLLGVNLSARQFQQPGLVDDVARILGETGLDPRCLKLEITESAMMADEGATLAALRQLKHLGVRLAIDDFGTGYSALSSLKHFPLDALKIDRSFIAGLGHDVGDMAIVRAVITFARTLGLSVTAEGIETIQQLHHLHALTCDTGQGYLFAAPLPSEEVDSFLATGAAAIRDQLRARVT